MYKYLFFILLVSLAGCSTTKLTSEGDNVVLSKSKPTDELCLYLGEVTSSAGNQFIGTLTSNANKMASTKNELRNKAAEIGASHVHLYKVDRTMHRTSINSLKLYGDAYDCKGK